MISITFLPGCRGRIAAPQLRRIARVVLAAEGVASNVGLEVVLAGAETVRDLNRLYRGRDEPTDVLSFASHESEAPFIDAPDAIPALGEVVICVPVADAQAAAAGRPVAGEIAHLLVHGLLHILGFDHEEPYDAARMKAREDELLGDLGYGGQYEHGH